MARLRGAERGFPVAGLEAFGPGDESARLRAVARDPAFREAVTWQNPAAIGDRAVAAFADRPPAWPHAVFQSVDLQLAAADVTSVIDGDYLAVLGDAHLGSNPLIQGVFAHRHPDPERFLADVIDAIGAGTPLLLPPWAPGQSGDTRGMPATSDEILHIAALPETRAQNGRRTWLPHELQIDGEDLVDRSGELRVPLLDVFWLPIFVAGVRSLDLFPDQGEHAPRLTIGRTVVRRESWSIPAGAIPEHPDQLAAFARDRGMPRRVFAKSPLERKPMYLDLESRVLSGILCRHTRRAAAAPGRQSVHFSEIFRVPRSAGSATRTGIVTPPSYGSSPPKREAEDERGTIAALLHRNTVLFSTPPRSPKDVPSPQTQGRRSVVASDIFVKIDDIKGESLDAKHKDEIEVLSWSWGVTNAHPTAVGSGGGAGRASFRDLSFTHKIDRASPVLMRGCATGVHLKEATITHRKAGKGQQEFLIVKMNDVIITSVTDQDSGGDLVESVSLAFAKVDVQYRPQKSDGSLDAGIHFKYDIKGNKEA